MEPFPAAQIGRPKASELVFVRLRDDSGDWDYNPKVTADVLNSLVEYTVIPSTPTLAVNVVALAKAEGRGSGRPLHP
ncbi:MAG TPA: hypothetical protein VF921_00755 [Vicinamibacterales bacterium]